MTLLELTVGLVVTGLIVAAGYAAFGTVIDRREQTTRVMAETARAAGVRRTILRWIDGAVPQVATTVTDPSTIAQLQFNTYAETPIQSPVTTVRLFVSNGSDGLGRGLIAMLHPSTGVDSLRVTIDPDVNGMLVQYLIASAGTPMWVTADAVGNTTPAAIRVQLSATDPQLASALALPIEAATASR